MTDPAKVTGPTTETKTLAKVTETDTKATGPTKAMETHTKAMETQTEEANTTKAMQIPKKLEAALHGRQDISTRRATM